MLTFFSGAAAAAREAPTDLTAFTLYAKASFQKALPGAKIEMLGPLGLSVDSGAGNRIADLRSVFTFCAGHSETCDVALADYVRQMSAALSRPADAPNKSALRVLVRPSAYVDAANKGLAGRAELIAAPLQGDFWMIGAQDLPTAIATLDSRGAEALKISEDEALEIGKRNMREHFTRALAAELKGDHHGVVVLTNDPYESSLFAFPELWAPIAAQKGKLVVAVPAADVVLFSTDQDEGAEESVRKVARVIMGEVRRPFSDAVFRWAPQGWAAIAPH